MLIDDRIMTVCVNKLGISLLYLCVMSMLENVCQCCTYSEYWRMCVNTRVEMSLYLCQCVYRYIQTCVSEYVSLCLSLYVCVSDEVDL